VITTTLEGHINKILTRKYLDLKEAEFWLDLCDKRIGIMSLTSDESLAYMRLFLLVKSWYEDGWEN
jgi:hypothetical protein